MSASGQSQSGHSSRSWSLEVAYHRAKHLVVEIAAVAQPQGLVALHRRDRPLPEHVSGRSQLGVKHLRELLGDQVWAGQ